MTNKYLEILNLQPGATEADIKRAYRSLSKKYHPDVSKLPDAREKFIEITEAYDFLLTVGPNPHQETVSYDYDPFVSEYEEWRRDSRKRAKEKARQQEKARVKLAHFLVRLTRPFVWMIMVLNMIMVVDFFLPKEVARLDPLHAENLDSENFSIPSTTKNEVYLYSSPILEVPDRTSYKSDGIEYVAHNRANLYRVFGALIPMILVAACCYFFLFKSPDQRLASAMTMMTMAFIQLVVYLQ